MHSLRRIVRWLVVLVITGLLPACAAGTRPADVAPTGAPPDRPDSDLRGGITVDQFSGFPIRSGGRRGAD
jgi:hypothetical protein